MHNYTFSVIVRALFLDSLNPCDPCSIRVAPSKRALWIPYVSVRESAARAILFPRAYASLAVTSLDSACGMVQWRCCWDDARCGIGVAASVDCTTQDAFPEQSMDCVTTYFGWFGGITEAL